MNPAIKDDKIEFEFDVISDDRGQKVKGAAFKDRHGINIIWDTTWSDGFYSVETRKLTAFIKDVQNLPKNAWLVFDERFCRVQDGMLFFVVDSWEAERAFAKGKKKATVVKIDLKSLIAAIDQAKKQRVKSATSKKKSRKK